MPNLPTSPKLGQGVPGGSGALPNLFGPSGAIPPVDPKMVPHIHPTVNTQPMLPLQDPLQNSFSQSPAQAGGFPTLQQVVQQPVQQNTTTPNLGVSDEARTLAALAKPGGVTINSDPHIKLLIMKPTPNLTQAIMSDPTLRNNYDQAFKTVTGHDLDAAALGSNTQAAAFGLPPQSTTLLQKLASETGQTLVGLGPGLVNYGIKTAEHPIGEQEKVGTAIGQSFARTYSHPLRDLNNNPLEFLLNTAAVPFAAAGTAARVGELSRAAEAADAVDASTAAGRAAQTVGHSVTNPGATLKTLFRPQPQARTLTQGEGGVTLHPPAYKSALGGMLQTKVLDPLLEKHLASPTPFDRPAQSISQFLHMPTRPLTAPARFGRKARQDLENDIRTRAGALATRMPEERAANIARGTAFAERHQALFNGGVQLGDMAQQPWRDWAPIKPPPTDLPNKLPEQLTDADLKDHPVLSQSEPGLARQFERGSSMIPTEAEVAKEPDKYRYVPQQMINSMKTYKPPTGSLANLANTVDRGTQLIRSGRFLTPAYAQWAVQNGLIHASQAGAFVFRNAWQLKREFPKLPTDVRGAIDGAMGKGIAKATSGGEAAEGGKLAQSMSHIQQFWHKFDDQWARRMSAIHELNSAGYHNAGAWTKLYKTDPAEFRKIVAGQGNREAINYTEMSPAERQTFQKLFTAYGWTRGASTYAARFPLQHPVQARVGSELGNEGAQDVNSYYKKLGGMVPTWLQSYLPIGGSKLLDTQFANPAGTLGGLIQEAPGATQGQTESLLGELAPVPTAIEELMSGENKYGTAYKGNQRLAGPLGELASRFKPLSAFETFSGGKKGGTFSQSKEQGALQFAGVPTSNLRNPTNTAALGEKDYEQALATPDKIRFQYTQSMAKLPSEVALYERVAGTPLAASTLSRLKTDYDSVEQRDIFQYQYANTHGAKTWKSLPPLNKLAGTLDWMAQHGYSHPQIAAYQAMGATMHDDKSIESLVNTLWQSTGIGQVVSTWNSVIKGLKPPVLTKANP